MKRFSWLISSYIIRSVLPYFLFSWILLSVILFVQQAGRFSDIFFSVNIPKTLVWQLTFALVPSVIAFTCPMAVLVGVIIGLSRMQGDSELIAVRAAGIGNLQIAIPIIILGILLSFFAFFTNLKGVPWAAQIVRKVAVQTALYKLESPIEPGVFNSEVNGFTIYVKDGDILDGRWKNVFIYSEDKDQNSVRLITSSKGRIDSEGEKSELLLENAVINTFPTDYNTGKYAIENLGEIRFAINTKRSELIEKFSSSKGSLEELGLDELAERAKTKEGKERIEAQLLWQRRIILSITPLIFALLGTSLVLRFNRGGRGFGIFLALVSLVIYYLLTLLGEQLARTSQLNVLTGGLIPIAVSLLVILWFFLSNRVYAARKTFGLFKKIKNFFPSNINLPFGKYNLINLTTGILDFDIISNLLKYFLLTLGFLTTVYMVFTAFELWKFAGEINNGIILLGKYLFYLIPFIYIQLAPSALMIATLATYVIKSRQNEIVTWTAAGSSAYRILLPCFIFMFLIGGINWGIQEKILPKSNVIQDRLRDQIRSRGIMANKSGRIWAADNSRIYFFELVNSGSDYKQHVKDITIYEFTGDGSSVQTIYKSPQAEWENNKIKLLSGTEKIVWTNGRAEVSRYSEFELPQTANPFGNLTEKPSHLSTEKTKEVIKNTESETEQKIYEVALEKKSTTPFLPAIITLFTAPFALSLNRKGKVVTLGYAVAIWLFFLGISNIFEQFGLNGLLSPRIAVWSPVLLFTILGAYLMTKIKT